MAGHVDHRSCPATFFNRHDMKLGLAKFTIRTRLLVIIMLAAVPAITLFVYESVREYQDAYEDAGNHLVHLAELVASNESKVVQGVHDMLTAISESPFIRSRDHQACNEYLTKINRRYPTYHTFSFANAEGDILCSGNPLVTPLNISDRPYYQVLMHEKRFVGAGYLINRVTGLPVASFVLPILHDGQVTGIVTTSLRLEAFTEVAREIRIPEHASIAIVDAQGILLARRPEMPGKIGTLIASTEVIAGFPRQHAQVMEVAEAGQSRRLYAVAPALHEGRPIFYVIVGLKKTSLIAPAAKALIVNLAALLSLVLLSLAGTWWAGQRLLITPVRRLITAAQQVAGGNLKARANWGGHGGELAELAAHFDTMAGAIEKREEENLAARTLIEYLADHDELTKLPNRRFLHRYLAERLIEAKKSGQQLAVFFLDIERISVVNESLGHIAGDQLLAAIAERLIEDIDVNRVAARLGSTEFVYAIASIGDREGVLRVVHALAASLSRPYLLGDEKITIGVGIGICLCPADTEDGPTAIRYAQVAMRHGKQAGRNPEFFAGEMNLAAMRRMTLENELRQALENNEFLLYYQPQVSLRTRQIVGAEALIRWRHPQHGLISPVTFIALAEETRLILALGEWTLRTACFQSKTWMEAGLPVQVGVNVSAHQFRQAGFVEIVKQALADSGLEARSLELEVTETVLLADVGDTLAALQKMGITLAIDDFGTGFSNLSYLRDLPVDKLKIDQSFIINITRSPGNQAITQAIIDVARSLGLRVIAEGVDSEESCRTLLAMDCDEAQGYYCGKPMPADAFTELLRRNEPGLLPFSMVEQAEDG